MWPFTCGTSDPIRMEIETQSPNFLKITAVSEHPLNITSEWGGGVFFCFSLSLSLLCLIVSGQTAISVWEQEYAPIGSSCGGTFFTQRGAVGFRRGEKLHTAVNTANPQWKLFFFFLVSVLFSDQIVFSLPFACIYTVIEKGSYLCA